MFRTKIPTLLLALPLLMMDSARCDAAAVFSSGITTGNVQNSSLIEASGIVASRFNPNVLWAHNDSGNAPQIFSMSTAGANLGTYYLRGTSNIDWEDIANGPGPVDGSQYLYIGDIGDNNAIRANISIYRVPEPVVSDTQSAVNINLFDAVKLTFAYPDGKRDAESLFVDPLTKDIYIVTKRDTQPRLYRAVYPQSTTDTNTLEFMVSFQPGTGWPTAADISVTGNEIIVRSTTSARLYQRPVGGSIADAFNTVPTTMPLNPEIQGEAIGFDPNGWGYYTASEGSNQPIYYFNRQPPPAGDMYWDSDGAVAGSYVATGVGMGGSGSWSSSARNWYNGSAEVAWGNGNNAVFWGAAGTVDLASAQTVNGLAFKSNGYILTSSTLTLAGSTVAVDPGVTATINSIVSGSAGLVKTGSGRLNLTNANSFDGGTTIAGGTLFVTNSNGSATGTGPVAVNAGAILGGTGTVTGDVTSGGVLAPGETVGTLHIGGAYSQVPAGRLEIEVASLSSHDVLAVTGPASLSGTLAVSLVDSFMPSAGDLFEIITAAGYGNSTFTNISLPTLADDLVWGVHYGASSVTLSVALAGDFNGNGTVDAADYVVWRKGLGTNYTQNDYNLWLAHFGQTSNSASGTRMNFIVPEPAALPLMILVVGSLVILRSRYQRLSDSRVEPMCSKKFASRGCAMIISALLSVSTLSAAEQATTNDSRNAAVSHSDMLFLAIDDVSLPLRKNVGLYLSKPQVRAEPVLVPSPLVSNAPDNLAAHFYGTVLHDAGKFRMWYYACHRGTNPDWPPRKMQQVAKKPAWLKGVTDGFEVTQGPLCYAESTDGIHWTKPALGQVLFKGSRENNALDLPHTIVSGAAVIRDDAEPDPARRYKMVYQYFPDQSDPPIAEYGVMPSVACAVSPDGLQWTMTAIPFANQFVEHCSFVRHDGKFILHYQVFRGSSWSGVYTEGGGTGGRTGVTRSTFDFDHWPDLWELAFALPEPRDQVHLGVGATSLGNVCVGLYGLWHDRADFGEITGDLGLVVSNDGIRFREPAPGHVFIHRDESSATAVADHDFKTILCQGNGILNVGDETLIYHGRWRNVGQKAEDVTAHYRAEVALATLPRDRWGALGLNPGIQEGTVCSAALELPSGGCEVLLNAEVARNMRVELTDEHFQPLPDFSGSNGGTLDIDGGLDCVVKWPHANLASLGGKKVRLLVHLKKVGTEEPRLYALTLRTKSANP